MSSESGATSTSWYLYGFVPEGTSLPPSELTGIDGRPIEMIDAGGFLAAATRVSGEDYEDEVLSERLKNLAWVGHRGLEHERVVTWFVDQAGILPTRLFTLYRSRQGLEKEASQRQERVLELLGKFANLREWHVKLSFEEERVQAKLAPESPEIRQLDEAIANAAPGRRYLLERRRSQLAGDLVDAVARRVAAELEEDLVNLALETRTLTVPGGVGGRTVLNVALLAPHERSIGLRQELEKRSEAIRDRGFDVEFSGPWAPYRFIPNDLHPHHGEGA